MALSGNTASHAEKGSVRRDGDALASVAFGNQLMVGLSAKGVSEFLCLRRVEELVHGVDRRLATNERRGGQVDS